MSEKLYFKTSACIAVSNQTNRNGNLYTEECLKNMADKEPDKYEFRDGKLYVKKIQSIGVRNED